MRLRLLSVVGGLVVAVAAFGAAGALADSSVLPDTPDLPWTDPNHQSPLEQLASGVASQIAGREVRVYCNGQNDWDTLARNVGFDGAVWWGYVASPRYWYPSLGTWAESSTHTQLAPIACERMWQFGKATVKPTRCAATRTTVTTKKVKVRYRAWVWVKVKKRVKVKGKWVIRTVRVKKRVWKTRTTQREIRATTPLDPVPCYTRPDDSAITVATPEYRSRGYYEFVFALATLAHESIHLFDGTSGRPVPADRHAAESRAECLGMQNIAFVAQQFGAGPDDARAIANWYATNAYPARETEWPDYWSAECKPNGALDQTPNDGVWP